MKTPEVIYKRYDFFSVLFDLAILSGFRKDQRKLVAMLRPQSRTLTLDETKQRLIRGEGTLVTDSVYPGWPGFRFWWCETLDEYKQRTEPGEDSLCAPEDYENLSLIADGDSGIGLLVETAFYGHPLEDFMEQQFNCSIEEGSPLLLSGHVKMMQAANKRLHANT